MHQDKKMQVTGLVHFFLEFLHSITKFREHLYLYFYQILFESIRCFGIYHVEHCIDIGIINDPYTPKWLFPSFSPYQYSVIRHMQKY